MWPLRVHLPRGRDRAFAAPAAHARGARGAPPERDPAFPLRELREAVRHAPDGRRDAGKACGPFDVCQRGGAAPAADVRRLPRGGHDVVEERGVRVEAGSRFLMQAAASPVVIRGPLAPEEAARGDFYALLGRLFHAAPDAALLRELARAEPIPPAGDAALAQAWQRLVHASSAMDEDAAAEEFDALFAGVCKSQVSA